MARRSFASKELSETPTTRHCIRRCIAWTHARRVEYYHLGSDDILRRRLRVKTDKGNEFAIALSRQEKLFDGVVLLLDGNRAVIVRANATAWLAFNRSTQPQPLSSGIAVATCTGASASPDRFYASPSMDLSRNIWHDLHHSSAPGGSRKLQMDSRGLLATLQHADSFFPSGAVSFSWGLEALRADGLVQSADDVALFAAGQLRHRWATADRPSWRQHIPLVMTLRPLLLLIDCRMRWRCLWSCAWGRSEWAPLCLAFTRGSKPRTLFRIIHACWRGVPLVMSLWFRA